MPSRVSEPETYGCEESPGLCSLISGNGFLPAEQPLRRLPDAYYEEWEEIVGDLPNLIKERAIRSKIDNMSLLTTAKLKTEREWQRAYVILSFLTHSYIWGGDVPSEILPPSITVPFLQVSDHLQLPPIATYAALNLWNFSSTSSNNSSSTDSSCSTGEEEEFTDLDNLRALHTFSGTEDESWFYVLSVAAEARGARAIPVMLRAAEAVRRGDHDAVSRGLVEMAGCVRGLARLLGRMQERCDPAVFYHQLRPFLAGTRNMTAAGLPADGVFYDEGDGEGRWRQLRGGSNGQSSLIQFFDLVLGVEHTSAGDRRTTTTTTTTKMTQKGDGAPGELSFHEEVSSGFPAR
ncbi:putative indoleamine -dioxygenase [Rosellinia necatrix]|uniref:Putative indoleamine-dioxygenase n=1 Tax=Rosellinia necatrix TaxID=77044 RepID=A0A1S8A978_ROSNE|nr:putative indoleamine -dioxygenase [Rosellinia necatrix]